MSAFDSALESRGWPFADCAIHVQFRGEDNRHFSVDEIRQTCDAFGRILKVYTWTAKRSQKPQACVLFDSLEAVKAADRSTHGAIRRAPYQVHPPMKGIKPTEKASHLAHRPVPTGPRYQPYSLDARPHSSYAPPPRASPPDAGFISFPPKREPISPNGPIVSRHANKPSFSSPRTDLPNGSSLAVTQPTPSSPAKPSSHPRGSEQAEPPQATPVEGVEQTQINQKLKTDIRDLVSTHIDSMAKVQEVEAENQKLKERLRISEEELALLEDTVKRVEGREEAAIALLTDTETRSQEQLQSLKTRFEAVESAKTKAETELDALKQKYGVLEAQLLSTQEQLRLFSLSKRSVDQSMRAHSDSPRPGLDANKTSSVERDDTRSTSATAADHLHNPSLEKGTLQNLAGLLDAFKEIDDLVRNAFHA